MRKGLTTLTAVAVALLGFNAMAMSPVVSDLGTPVVGNAESATFDFIFPDAWNLDLLVFDQETSDAGIAWSYVTETFDGIFAGVGDSRYLLNGVEALIDPSAAEAIAPPAGNRIDTQNLDPATGQDSNNRTVTIRDRTLTPIGSPNVDPGAAGIVGSEPVTLFASDGSTVSWASTIIFTENGGEDHFSGVQVEVVEVLDGSTADISTNPAAPGDDFTYTDFDAISSQPETNTQFSQDATFGACITAAALGDNIGSLDSPDGRFALADLYVYRVRTEMSTTAAVGETPLISMTYNSPLNEYGGEIIILDNVGGANAPNNGSNGRPEFQFWIGPPGLEVAAWRDTVSGAFAPASNADSFKLVLRLLDVAAVVGGNARAGSVCWKTVELGRILLTDLLAGETNIPVPALAAANGTTGWQLFDNIAGAVDVWTVNFTAGTAVVTADTTPTVGVAFMTLRPGNGDGTAGNPAGLPDDYPIAWDTPEQLLHIAMTIAADATAAADPPEVLRLGADTPTQEIITNHFMAVLGIGEKLMPTTTAVTYHAFHYTHSLTAAVFANADTIRPLLDFADRDAGGEFGTDGSTTASGSWTVSNVTVGDVSANNQ
jgi:hypothetical protein